MAETVKDSEGRPLAKGWSGQPVWDLAMRLVENEKPGRLLDAPAGGGYLAAQLATRGFQIAGMDLVRDLWQFPQHPFVCADMDAPMPFQTGSFDVALHVGGLAYMENVPALMREFHRILAPGGAFGITIENILTMESRLRFMMNGTYRWYPHYQYQGENKEELFLINREPIRITGLLFHLERAGFTIEKVLFGGKPSYHMLLPLGLLFSGATNIHNEMRKGKGKLTPPIVNNLDTFIYRHVGVLARKKK